MYVYKFLFLNGVGRSSNNKNMIVIFMITIPFFILTRIAEHFPCPTKGLYLEYVKNSENAIQKAVKLENRQKT